MKTRENVVKRILQFNLVLIFVITSSLAFGQTKSESDFEKWDKNGDKNISRSEFKEQYVKDYGNDWENNGHKDAMYNKKDRKYKNNEIVESYSKIDTAAADTTVLYNQGRFDDQDFYGSTYDMWDADKDQRLSEKEWQRGFDTSYGDYVTTDFKGTDTNKDGYVSYGEYHHSLEKSNYYSDWDANNDKWLSYNEVSRNVFDNWDNDNDNFISENEYAQQHTDFYDKNR